MLSISPEQRDAVIAHAVRSLPLEACGVLLGDAAGVVREIVPTRNAAHSAVIYEIDSRDLLGATRRADELGCEVIGCFHSHTHTDAYPSETDVRQAPDPSWHYVLVSLRYAQTAVRSFRIVSGEISEEEITVLG